MKHSPFTNKLPELYESICGQFDVSGSVLEIGCGPSKNTLLNLGIFKNSKYRVGINLKAYDHYDDFEVLECNANDMSKTFDDSTFEMVLCNVVLEHDKFFWKSLSEIRRITKPGGVFILGVPGLVTDLHSCKWVDPRTRKKVRNFNILNASLTYRVHNAPGDFWRFTEQAYREVLMEGFHDVKYSSFLMPPIIIGSGVKDSE